MNKSKLAKKTASNKTSSCRSHSLSGQNNQLGKIQDLMEKENAKESLLDIQEEIEEMFLEVINNNWSKMTPSEKKSAITLGRLIQDIKKNLRKTFEEGVH
ncbi:MAG: hypothetical protein XD98_0147 [Microgenomates bacterium 39_6]|nr:MAG: hypothetical protein XD98_0147 [Microgenomates bacterium 39_6]